MARRTTLNRRLDDDDEPPRSRERGRDRDDDRRGSRSSGSRSSGGTRWKGYQPRSSEDVRHRAEQTGGGFDTFLEGADMFRSKVGDNTVRFLPAAWDDPKHYGYDVWVHSYVGDGSYLCLDKMKKERCPICLAAKEAKAEGDDDTYQTYKPKQRVLAYVLDRNSDDDVPLIYDMSWTQDRDIAAVCDTKQGTLYIDHPDEGYDLTFKRKGNKLNTRYFGYMVDREPTPILQNSRDQEALLDRIAERNIPSLLKFHSAEIMAKAIEGGTAARDEDLDDDEPPRRGKGREEETRGRREPLRGRGRDEEEEEDEDDAGDDRRADSRGRGTRAAAEDRPRPRTGREDRVAPDERPSRRRDTEEDDRPARARSRTRDADGERTNVRRRAVVDDDERDEEEPDEPEADEEDVDARPRARRGRKRDDEEIPF